MSAPRGLRDLAFEKGLPARGLEGSGAVSVSWFCTGNPFTPVSVLSRVPACRFQPRRGSALETPLCLP